MAIQLERKRLLTEAFDLLPPFLTIRFMTFPSQGMGVVPNRCDEYRGSYPGMNLTAAL
jgi:hypothetical protein